MGKRRSKLYNYSYSIFVVLRQFTHPWFDGVFIVRNRGSLLFRPRMNRKWCYRIAMHAHVYSGVNKKYSISSSVPHGRQYESHNSWGLIREQNDDFGLIFM